MIRLIIDDDKKYLIRRMGPLFKMNPRLSLLRRPRKGEVGWVELYFDSMIHASRFVSLFSRRLEIDYHKIWGVFSFRIVIDLTKETYQDFIDILRSSGFVRVETYGKNNLYRSV